MDMAKKQQLLLRAIIRMCGGPTELERLTGFPRQNFTNWQLRGRVPLVKAAQISKNLGLAKSGFNYAEFREIDENPMSWEETVKSYSLPKELIKTLLS